jgi:hypothetical protein
MKYQQIRSAQKEQGFDQWQLLIDNGMAWKMEGSIGRQAMDLLESGACMLPKKAHYDAYGNRVPSRDDLKNGTKGTFLNSVNYYTQNQW